MTEAAVPLVAVWSTTLTTTQLFASERSLWRLYTFNSCTLVCQLTCLSNALCFLKFFSRNLLNGLKKSPSTTFICKQLKIKSQRRREGLCLASHYTRVGKQGWGRSESTRLKLMWPRLKSRCRCHMWVAFVVDSLLCCERFFSGYSSFPLLTKNENSKFPFDQESGTRRTAKWKCHL